MSYEIIQRFESLSLTLAAIERSNRHATFSEGASDSLGLQNGICENHHLIVHRGIENALQMQQLGPEVLIGVSSVRQFMNILRDCNELLRSKRDVNGRPHHTLG